MLRENVYAHFPGITLLYCLKIASTSVSTAIGEAGVFTEYFCCYNFFFQERLARQVLLVTTTGKRPREGKAITSPTGLVLVWNHQNYLGLLLIMMYFKSWGCCPATLPRRQAGTKMNERMTFSLACWSGLSLIKQNSLPLNPTAI